MKIAVCFPCILLIVCRLPSAQSVPCSSYADKPFFERNTSSLIFAEEGDTALLNFCSAANYCSIQWFKNGQRLDPSQNFTDGHLVVKDDGRMLWFSPVLASDKGNYTCVATNNAGSVRKAQELEVKRSNKCPAFTTESHKALDRLTEVGADHFEKWEIETNMDLDCYFFKEIRAGNSSNDTDCSDCGWCYKDTVTPDIWYAVFNLTHISQKDFATYKFFVYDKHRTCTRLSVEINLSQNKTSFSEVNSTAVTTATCSIVLFVMLCTLTWHVIKVDVQLFVKDHLYKTEDDDGRCYDAYISYTWTDTDRLFVLQLKSRLEKKGYRVYVPEIDNLPGGCTAHQLTQALQRSRRFIMVLSPEYVRANFTAFEVNIFIEAVTQYKNFIIPIEFQGLLSPDESAILRHVLKVGQTVTWANIDWPLSDNSVYHEEESLDTIIVENSKNSKTVMEKSFRMKGFKQLLLKLPPKPKRTTRNFYLLE